MPVYVDDARIAATVGRISARWSHLFADTEAELDEFAVRLGLDPKWKQTKKPHFIHFDLVDHRRDMALELGAVPIRYRDLPQIVERIRLENEMLGTALEKPRLRFDDAMALASELVELLRPNNDRIMIGGSLRRRRASIGDIEILCIPRFELEADPMDLFGEPNIRVDQHFKFVSELRSRGVLEDRPNVNGQPGFGTKWQRVKFKGFATDIFCCTAEQWGYTAAIRTGPADFSKALVTTRMEGGVIKATQMARDWRLIDGGVVRATPEETDLFAAIELPWIEPWDRDEWWDKRKGKYRPDEFALR